MPVPARSVAVAADDHPNPNLLAAMGPDVTLCILCAAALAVVGRLFGAHYVLRLSTMLLPGLVAPGILVIHALRGRFRDEALATLRDWMPLVFVAVVFDNLENYTGLVRATTIDATLHHIDLALFGVEPTVWMRHIYAPLVTDWMASCYAIFLITPMFLAIVVSLRGRRDDFREMALAVMLQMWIAFFIFICLPAGPPRYFAPLHDGPFTTPLPSFFGFNDALQARWDTYSPLLVRASFPSLHCAYATLTLVYAWRFGDAVLPGHRRAFFFVVLPLELSLYVSTVYLRHHWIPDIAAGIVLSLFVCRAAPWLRARWPEMNRRPVTRGVVRDRTAGGTHG
ncbi:MAG TPA: phosphatase PAP2 family protein [Polyangia bacterium]